LTAAFALAMVVVLAAAALFVYLRQQADLSETVDDGLRSRSDDVAALIRRSDTDLDRTGDRLAESEESFVQVLTPDGRWVDGTSKVRAPALRPEETRRASLDATIFERKVPGIDETARMLARPAVAAGGRSLIVVTGVSLEDTDDALADLLTSFLIGGPIAVLLASGFGYLLATAGFRPVEAMRERAERISLSREGERLPLPAARDEIRRLGKTLNEMLARLEASLERERRFVADASHELRTPIAVLKTELETLLRRASNDLEGRKSLTAALEETDHLGQLAEDLLLLARAADGRLPVRREKTPIRDLLERTQQRFTDRAREQGREIHIDVPSDIGASVDPLRIRQALGNLVDNALRYGTGDIQLRARGQREDVEIEVSDEGPGFPPQVRERAFERFAREEGSTLTRSGAGLGLAIVQAIAEAHGGTATIIDVPSGGATVRLRIPPGAGTGQS
jgi:signal transduction histidine kinase